MPFRPPRVLRRLIALFTVERARSRHGSGDGVSRRVDDRASNVRAGMSRSRGGARRPRALRQRAPAEGTGPRRPDAPASSRTSCATLRHMGRGLRQEPGFTLAVVLTLALGIGGNTAIFSVVDQLLLRPLPYPDGEQLVTIYETSQPGASQRARRTAPLQRLAGQLARLAAREPNPRRRWPRGGRRRSTLTGAGEPVRVNAQLVSSEFFPLLGVQPLLGRTLSDADDRPNAPRVACPQPPTLAGALWRRSERHRAHHPVERQARPRSSASCRPASGSSIRTTTCGRRTGSIATSAWRETSGRFINVVARLKPDATIGDARAEMEGIAAAAGGEARLQQEHRR